MSQKNIVERLNQIKDLVDECLSELAEVSDKKPSKKASSAKPPATKLDFSLNERAFVKKHARAMSGPKKFVLLVAYLAKGDPKKEVTLKDVKKNWNKMTSSSLLGGKFNSFYTNTAKENGWINTPSKGVYTLRQSWKEVLEIEA